MSSKTHYCPCCESSFLDLGWLNNLGDQPLIDATTEQCKKMGHHRRDFDTGEGFRGMEHVVGCKDCKYVYRYDSSD